MEDQNSNKIEQAAERAANAVFEKQISEDSRQFLNSLEYEKEKPSRRILYVTGLAASILVLVASLVTINISHSDSAIAEAFGINQINARSGEDIYNATFTDAVQAYYSKNYQESSKLLNGLDLDDKKVSDYKDWLSLLITLQTAGSDSESFYIQMDKIISDENHEFHLQAQKMTKKIKPFWHFLIFSK